ncbi:MAG: S41 family peptidase [Bacillota bacterium]|nr:S41 family peptidase [Bacillota bacterium]
MKKITVGLLCLFLVITTALTTFFVTTTILVQGEQKLVTESRELQAKYQDLEDLKRYIRENYYKEVSDEMLMEGAKKGLFQILGDPYSVFMNEEEFKSFVESSSGRFPGIGVHITPNPERGIEIIAPIEDTPAFAAGLKPLDIIRAVNGVPYTHAEMDVAIKQIKGEPGTDVTLTIYRKETEETFDVVITRAWIDVKVVKSRMIEDGIGYLKLTSFDNGSAAEFRAHFEGLLEQGAKGVVIDLRNNPGGSLNQCVEIADYLLPKGLIVYTEGRTPDTNNKYYSDAQHVEAEIVLLVNEGSASASEIVTGAVKDHGRGKIIGTKTFGKGIVQTYRPFGNSGLKLTTSEYFTPNGINIHGLGIEADIVVEASEAFKTTREPKDEDDNQLQRALEELRQQIR